MKQHITKEQLNQLTSEQTEKLQEWCFSKSYIGPISNDGKRWLIPNLSIGQLIEFLDEHGLVEIIQPIYENEDKHLWMVEDRYERFSSEYHQELCDSLWESVKECL